MQRRGLPAGLTVAKAKQGILNSLVPLAGIDDDNATPSDGLRKIFMGMTDLGKKAQLLVSITRLDVPELNETVRELIPLLRQPQQQIQPQVQPQNI